MEAKRSRDNGYQSRPSTPYEGEILTTAMRVRKAMVVSLSSEQCQIPHISSITTLNTSSTKTMPPSSSPVTGLARTPAFHNPQQRGLQQTKLDGFFKPAPKRKLEEFEDEEPTADYMAPETD